MARHGRKLEPSIQAAIPPRPHRAPSLPPPPPAYQSLMAETVMSATQMASIMVGYTTLIEQNRQLNADLVAANSNLTSLQEEILPLRNVKLTLDFVHRDLAETKKVVATLTDANSHTEHLRHELQAKKDELAKSLRQVDDLRLANSKLHTDNSRLAASLHEAQDELEKLNEVIVRTEARETRMWHENERTARSYASVTTKSEKLQKCIDKLTEELAECRAQACVAPKASTAKVGALEAELCEAREEVLKKETEVLELRRHLSELEKSKPSQKKVKALQQRIAKMEAEHATEVARIENDRNNAVLLYESGRTEFESSKTRRDKVAEILERSNATMIQTQKENERLRKMLDETNSDAERISDENLRLRKLAATMLQFREGLFTSAHAKSLAVIDDMRDNIEGDDGALTNAIRAIDMDDASHAKDVLVAFKSIVSSRIENADKLADYLNNLVRMEAVNVIHIFSRASSLRLTLRKAADLQDELNRLADNHSKSKWSECLKKIASTIDDLWSEFERYRLGLKTYISPMALHAADDADLVIEPETLAPFGSGVKGKAST